MSIKSNKLYKVAGLIIGFILINSSNLLAQCAMCRTSVENNVSAGETSLAAGLNTGILYLMVMPYLIVGTLAFLWYRNSKQHQEKQAKIMKSMRLRMN